MQKLYCNDKNDVSYLYRIDCGLSSLLPPATNPEPVPKPANSLIGYVYEQANYLFIELLYNVQPDL